MDLGNDIVAKLYCFLDIAVLTAMRSSLCRLHLSHSYRSIYRAYVQSCVIWFRNERRCSRSPTGVPSLYSEHGRRHLLSEWTLLIARAVRQATTVPYLVNVPNASYCGADHWQGFCLAGLIAAYDNHTSTSQADTENDY